MAQTGIATTQVAYDCSRRIIQEEMRINIAKRFALPVVIQANWSKLCLRLIITCLLASQMPKVSNNPRGRRGGWGYFHKFRIGVCRQGSESLILTKDERNENWYPISLHSWRNCFCACECFGGKLKAAKTFPQKIRGWPKLCSR